MRSLAANQFNRLVDGSVIRLGSLAGAVRASVAFASPAIELGRPAIDAIGTVVKQKVLHLVQRASAVLEPAADDIAIALDDLVAADASLALDMYSGVFVLAGHTVSTHGRSIFTRNIPSQAFQRELHGFGWLRHLAAADTPLARLNARALIEDWIDLFEEKHLSTAALDPMVIAVRLKSWLTYADWLVEAGPARFRHRLLAQVTRDFRSCRTARGHSGVAQLRSAASLVAAALAVPAFRRFLPKMMRQLDAGLKCQILADGGHISRNPSAIITILAELLPLRTAFAVAGTPASNIMMNAIDRMLPMLRFFIGPTGVLAHFNGAAPINGDLIDAVLAIDDTQGRAHGNASHSGYQRLEASETVVLMDCGTPPPSAFARSAHAGTLSFELTSSTNRIVINCGTSQSSRPEWRAAARATAAHSTISVGGKSSATPIETGVIAHLVGPTLIAGPRMVHVDRREHAGTIAVVASHDGYAASHNVIHERTLRLSSKGDRIDGRDILMPAEETTAGPVDYVARFHLDPAIRPVLLANGVVMLMADDGEAWEFHADDMVPTLEDSIYLADPRGPIPTQQIVLPSVLPEAIEQRWTFVRTRAAGRGQPANVTVGQA